MAAKAPRSFSRREGGGVLPQRGSGPTSATAPLRGLPPPPAATDPKRQPSSLLPPAKPRAGARPTVEPLPPVKPQVSPQKRGEAGWKRAPSQALSNSGLQPSTGGGGRSLGGENAPQRARARLPDSSREAAALESVYNVITLASGFGTPHPHPHPHGQDVLGARVPAAGNPPLGGASAGGGGSGDGDWRPGGLRAARGGAALEALTPPSM